MAPTDPRPIANFRISSQPTGNYTYNAIGNLITDTQEGITAIHWTPSNKIDSIVKSGVQIGYLYDAAGNRVRKQVWNGTTLTSVTMYVRDPDGNPLGVYTRQGASGDVTLSEVPLYGSDRLGMIRPELERTSTATPNDTIDVAFTRYAGQRHYELKDHLGNVRAVITDELKEPSTGAFVANQVSRTDYYPFGMAMASRTQSQSSYRYGFNGKENEYKDQGDVTVQDYGFRIYDPRVARFLSVDPLAAEYAWMTPYAFAEDDPIRAIDLDGLERLVVTHAVLSTGERVQTTRAYEAADIDKTLAETGVAIRYPVAAIGVGLPNKWMPNSLSYFAGVTAYHVSVDENLSTGDGSERNGYRHALWSAIITRDYGQAVAARFTNSHEGIKLKETAYVDFSMPPPLSKEAADEVVDFLNNEIGRRIAERLDSKSSNLRVAQEVLNVMATDGLWQFEEDANEGFRIYKGRISSEQYSKAVSTLQKLDNGAKVRDVE